MRRFNAIAAFAAMSAALFTAGSCSGGVEYDARLGDAAALVNGETISMDTLAVFEARLKKAGKFRGRRPLLDVLIKNRLVAGEYRALPGHTRAPDREPDREQAAEFMRLARSLDSTRRAFASLPAMIRNRRSLSAASLRSYFTGRNSGSAGRLIRISTRARANPVLLEYEFPNAKPGRLRLNTVLQAENPHGRSRVRAGDVRYLEMKTGQHLELLYLNHLADRAAPEHRRLSEIRRILEDRRLVNRYLLALGFKADIHDSPPALRARARAIPDARIRRYYNANRERFREVRGVRCRHIRLKNEKQAHRVHGLLKGGANFVALARRWSIAADARGPEPGLLGEIHNTGRELPFTHKLCLMQSRGKPSLPLRVPGNAYEIVLAEKRVEFHRPVTSKSVRREIALLLAARVALNSRRPARGYSRRRAFESILR